ncbi:MAG: T9SS type A sorting domain-containing protein, partial [Bacteroidales bacterium]|nr:T9SS type A sorting domain-containing protein [Bacteroidales bacterium]
PDMDDIKLLTLQAPDFDVDLEVSWTDVSVEATTTVTCNVDHYADYIDLYVVVFETSVNAYTGINGDTAFRNVVLDMLPTPAGKLLGDNWSRGNNDTRVNSWVYQSYVEDIEDLAIVAFVQDRNSKQILQAAVDFKTPQVGIGNQVKEMESLYIYPNPARTMVNVNLGSPSEKDGRFEIIDMNGRMVHNEQVPSGYQIYQLNVQSLFRGFYVIQWYEEGMLKGRNKLVKID